MEDFLAKAFEKKLCCNLVLYETWRCARGSFIIHALKFCGSTRSHWRHEQCSKIAGQISLRSHYYLKDLKCVYYGCCGLSYGKEDQTLFIDDEPSKHYKILNGVVFFFESFKGQMLLKNKVQWLDLASHLWPPLVGLPLAKTIQVHYDFMVKYFKFRLSSSLKNYHWFF